MRTMDYNVKEVAVLSARDGWYGGGGDMTYYSREIFQGIKGHCANYILYQIYIKKVLTLHVRMSDVF